MTAGQEQQNFTEHDMDDAPDQHEQTAQRADETTDDGPAEIEIDGQVYELPGPVASLIERLERERDENNELRLRAIADFRNFQRRSSDNEVRAMQSGVSRVVRALLPALDHVDLALNQNTEQLSVEQMLGGVKLLQQELAKMLESFGVKEIRPNVGDEFDANMHDAMMRQQSEDVPANHITSVMQTGYVLGDMVLRPAKVAVATPPSEES